MTKRLLKCDVMAWNYTERENKGNWKSNVNGKLGHMQNLLIANKC